MTHCQRDTLRVIPLSAFCGSSFARGNGRRWLKPDEGCQGKAIPQNGCEADVRQRAGVRCFVSSFISRWSFVIRHVSLLPFCLAFNPAAAAPGVVDMASSPFATIQTVGLDGVRWTHGFWADRFELCRTQMVPGMARLMEGTNYSQFYFNFEILAGLAEGKSRGAVQRR